MCSVYLNTGRLQQDYGKITGRIEFRAVSWLFIGYCLASMSEL